MKENNINRRDMIRISSFAALSNMMARALASASDSSAKMKEFQIEKINPDSEICYIVE